MITEKLEDRQGLPEDSLERTVFLVLSGCIAIVLVVQASTLFSVPLIDSYRWWGDESWLTIEFREQIRSGIFRHPYAHGATISQSNGLIFGSMWITAVLYGLPALVTGGDVVRTGRVVTFLLSLLLIGIFYKESSKHIRRHYVLVAILLMISSRVFLFTSHSARYDMLTGFVVMAAILCVTTLLARKSARYALFTGLLFGSTLLFTVHALLILIPLGLYAFYRIIRTRNGRDAGLFVAGAIAPVILCLLVQWISLGGASMFGARGAGGFLSNLVHIPIMHPLSRNVLVTSVQQKLESFAEMATIIPFLLVIAFAFDVYRLVQTRSFNTLSEMRRAAWLIVLGYLAFESFQFFYIMFVLPVVVWLLADTLQQASARPYRWVYHVMLVIAFGLTGYSIRDAAHAKSIGGALARDNENASTTMRSWLKAYAGANPPLVVLASPTVHEAIRWPEIRPMTTQFQIFPYDTSQSRTIDSVDVDYIEVIASGPSSYYIEEERQLRAIAATRGEPVLRVPGYLLDAARSYFSPMDPRQDTLLLYQWK